MAKALEVQSLTMPPHNQVGFEVPKLRGSNVSGISVRKVKRSYMRKQKFILIIGQEVEST